MIHVVAIFWREFAAYFGQPLAYIVLTVFMALLAVPTLLMWDVIDAGQAEMQSTFFWTGTAFVFLVPALTMRLIAEERRTGRMELLATLPITPLQMVLGKWLAAVAMVAIALVLTASWPIALGSFGDLDPFTVLTGYLGMLLMGAAFAAVGLAASSLTRFQVLAFLVSFVIIVVPYLLGYALESVPPELVGYLQYFTFRYHFANLARGVLDSRSLIFFAGVIAVGLSTTVLTIKWRRLRLMRTRYAMLVHALLHLVLIAAIAVVANHLSSAAFWRVDVTMDQRHTLSEVSRRTMGRLDKPLIARVFYSDELGPPYNNHKQALIEKLEELQAFSGGRMEVEFASPDSQKEHAEEAQKYGIEAIPYRFKQGTRFEAREIYMGVALLYGERGMKVGPLAAMETFEYELVKGIRALSADAKQRRTVGYSVGHGEPDLMRFPPDNPLGGLIKDLSAQYDVQSVALGGDDVIPANVDLMIVNGPEQPLSARAQYQLDQHLMAGKPVAFFLRGMRPDFRSMRAQQVRNDLGPLVGHFGVQVNKDVVFDRKHNEQFEVPIVKDGRMRRVQVDYPLIPTTSAFSSTHPVTAGLTRAVLPFTSSLMLAPELPPGVKGTVLISSEPDSSRVEGLLYVTPDVFRVTAPGEETGSFPVAIAVQGRFSSYFADKSIPPPAGTRPDDPSWQPDPTSKVLDGAPSRILVVGSADMVANNAVFVHNGVDWLLEDTELLQIRTELARSSAFERPSSQTASLVKAAIVGVPLLLLYLMGGLVWLLSRRRS